MRFTTVTGLDDNDVEVNMDNVTHMTSIKESFKTIIFFNGGSKVTVKGNASEIRHSTLPENNNAPQESLNEI